MTSRVPIINQCQPSSSSSNVAVADLEAWFKKEGTSVHDAYGEKTYYADDQSRFIPGSEPPVLHLQQVLVAFGRVQTPNQLAAVHNGTLDQAQTNGLDLLKCSWDDVLNQLEAAKLENLNSPKKTTRRADRVVAKAAPYIQPWVELVPEEYGLSVIKGGLTLLFATARHKEQNRDKIIQTFEEIPDMIRTMDAAYKLFGRDDDEDISGIAKSFYDELCKDIPDLIHILDGTRKRFTRVMNRLAGGTPETETVDGILEKLRRRSSELGSTISRIKMKLQAKTHADLQLIRSSIEETHMGMAAISGQLGDLASRQDIEQLSQRNNRNLAQFASVFGTRLINTLRQEVRSEVQSIVKDHSAGEFAAEAKTMVLRMAQENAVLREHIATQSLQIEYNRSRQPSPSPIPTLSELDLMKILDVDPQSWTDDLTSVLRQASRMDTDSKARARWLMKTRHFQSWLGTSHSTLLLAVGALALEKVSPMSVLAISLDLPNTVVLHFFCGKHLDVDSEDCLSGPNGMLRSLIAQLVLALRAPLPNLGAIDSHEFLQDCYNRTLPALCEVFRLLVQQVPQGVALYVLLDGVSWYEQAHWAADLGFIVGLLKDLAAPGGVPQFKVLLTSPNRTIEIQDLVDIQSEYISLAPGNMDYMPLVSYAQMGSLYNRV
ncbi:hypothetical protein PG985_001515 [Apiospora marii]|uniref:uncharacterized protein n=1 Tax=Apiospora marii TaxID=335849 RepID=UPI003130F7BA